MSNTIIETTLSSVLTQVKNIIEIDDNSDYKLVTISNKGVVRLRSIEKGSKIKTKKGYKIQAGQFIYSRLSIHNNAFGIVPDELDGALVTSEMPVFEVSDEILVEYLFYYLKSPVFKFSMEQLTKGVGRVRVKEKDFLKFKIQLPTYEIQKNKIAKIKDKESLIRKCILQFQAQKKLLLQLKQAILQDAIQGQLTKDWRKENPNVESASKLLIRIKAEKAQLLEEKKIKKEKPLTPITEEETPFELPRNWIWCRMQEAGLFERGKSKHRPRNDSRLFKNGNIPFVQTGEVARSKYTNFQINNCSNYYNDFGLSQSRLWDKGTLCITIAANIAQTGFLNIKACFPDSVVGFTSLSDNEIAKYLRYFIELTKTEIEKFAPATAQKNINLGIIYNLKLPLPPENEIKVIVKKTEALMQKFDNLTSQIKTSEANVKMLMQSVLQEAFN